jgi:hypothetical protein
MLGRVAGAVLAILTAAGTAVAEDWSDGWQQRWYRNDVETEPLKAENGAIGLPVTWPGDNEYVKAIPDGWHDKAAVKFTLDVPEDVPPHADVYLFVKDWDNLWFQVRLGPLVPGAPQSFSVPVHGAEAVKLWKPRFHYRPWHQRMPEQVREYGLKIDYTPANEPSEFTSTIALTAFELEAGKPPPPAEPSVRLLPRTPHYPVAGDCVEIAFETTIPFKDPFDRNEVDLMGTVVHEDGKVEQVRAFYYEGFLYDWYDGLAPLTPSGAPQFRLRYTPVEPGTYKISISGKIGERVVDVPEHVVKVGDSDFKGFIRPASFDKRLLMYSRDKTEFWGTALNTRSPYDTRYMDSFPFSQWPNRGIAQYRELFRKYKECGINIIELWMSDWFLGLESIPNAPGAHGIGYMNQYRAWKMDLLLQWAEEFDLKVVILLNNHGKFSTWCDADWDTTAINKEQGGFLDKPSEFFTDKRAFASFEKFADYAVARWGYSPALFAWKLFSEIDLTGKNRSWYKTPAVREWHARMGAYMTAQDPNKHMISTHWAESYKLVNEDLARIPEIDVLTLDAYYRGTGAKLGVDIMIGTVKFAEKIQKPCVITEYGGNPWADGMAHMMNGHHLSTWTGFFGMLANAPGYWWFPMVEEKDMYPKYAAFSRFTEGETRAGATTRWDTSFGSGMTLWELRKSDSVYYWIYDEYSFYRRTQDEPYRRRSDVSVDVENLPPGRYRVEFWNTHKGEVTLSRDIELRGAPYPLEIPPFRGDVAIKVKPAN